MDIHGVVKILLVASCYGNRDKLWLNGPIGLVYRLFFIEFISLPSLEVHEIYETLMVCDADAEQIARRLLLTKCKQFTSWSLLG